MSGLDKGTIAKHLSRIAGGIAAVALLAAAATSLQGARNAVDATIVARYTPMVVDGPATSRSGSDVTHSVICIPADTTPLDLAHARRWREVASDGDPERGAPCPDGVILATG
jgi:hypothetical protein